MADRTRVEVGTPGQGPTQHDLEVPDVPTTVVLNLSKVCNLWCGHCLYPGVESKRTADRRREPKFLPWSTLTAVVDEMARWSRRSVLRIAADGEPLIHPRAVEIISCAKQNGIPVSLTTNGILLTPRIAAQLLDSGIDVIDVSIDAASATTYAKVRASRGGTNFYSTVERNVRDLICARDARRPSVRTRIVVNAIDQPLAHDELPAFVDLWRRHGADIVLIRPLHTTSGQTGTRVSAMAAIERFPCKFPFTRLNVGFDAEAHPIVYYCSHDWLEKTVVGVLGRDGSLIEIWRGQRMQEIRTHHLRNSFPADAFCASCPDWYLGWAKSHHQLVTRDASKV